MGRYTEAGCLGHVRSSSSIICPALSVVHSHPLYPGVRFPCSKQYRTSLSCTKTPPYSCSFHSRSHRSSSLTDLLLVFCDRDEDQYLLRHSSPITDRELVCSPKVEDSLNTEDKGELERILAHLEDENRYVCGQKPWLEGETGVGSKGKGARETLS